MNSFDAVICVGLVFAVVTGFNTGLVRSAVTILAYLFAAPIAVAVMSAGVATGERQSRSPGWRRTCWCSSASSCSSAWPSESWRGRRSTRPPEREAGILDRLCGGVLGAVRVGLIAVTVVLVVDQLLPPQLQPPWLTGSQLRPWLSAAGQRGVKSLPPDVAATLDRLKRNQQI